MTTLHAIVLISALTGGGPPPAPASSAATHIFQELDARYHRGDLDASRYHQLRVLAVRAPRRLPADLRPLVGLAPRISATGVLVDAMQHVIRTGDWGGPVHDLLQPPPDLAYSLESTQWPIRVSYSSPGQAGYAQAILDAADLSWTVQIGTFGFYQPVIEPGYEPYRFYVEDAGAGTAGYTSPYDQNPATAYASCFSYIVIDPNLGGSVGGTVAHEINHSMQLSMDCIEERTFLENTAVFIEGLTDPSYFGGTLWFVPYFQAEPWRGLDYFDSGGGYQYGGVLWLHFLADRMAPNDAGIFARELWEACMQNSATANEPDYFDAVETVAAARGADASTIEALYADFAETRYFVGSRDDGQHMANADAFDAPPALTATHSVEDLPLVERQPPSAQRPAAFGTSYVRVNVTADWTRPITVSFDGDDDTRWEVRVVSSGAGQTTVSHRMTLAPDTAAGAVTVDPAGFEEVLLVVANLGTETYDPDLSGHPLSSYYYGLQPIIDPAAVTAVVPAAVIRGHQNLHVRVQGENFVYGPDFAIHFSDPMLQVVSIDGFSRSEVLFTLTVPAGAPLGPYDITVVNAGGQEATGEGLITVVDALGTLDPGPKPKGCQIAPTPGPASLLLLVALLAILLRRRRR